MDDRPQPADRPDVLAFGVERRPPARRWRRWAAAALVAGLAVGGAGVAIAATDTPSPSPSESPGATAPRLERRGHGLGFPWKGAFGALHGEFVVPDSGGGYQTLAVQRGEVTGVSNSEIKVKSEDGYEKAYAVTAETSVNSGRDGIGSVRSGEQVSVVATVENGKATAIRVVDVADARRPFERFGRPRLAPEQSPEGSTPTPS
jgi:hypothetical protein